jgi:Zn ribbon nucleic-acid-binding protein
MPSAPMKVHKMIGREVLGTWTICAECQGDVFRFYDLDGHNHMECVACGARYCASDTGGSGLGSVRRTLAAPAFSE